MKAKLSTADRKSRKPIEIKRGNVSVTIYTGTNRVGDKTYPQFTLVYYDGNHRKKLRFADLEAAKREGDLVATKLANGENEVLRLTSADRTMYVQAVDHLRPLGVPLNLAVLEYVSAVKSLPDGTTLKEAVDFFKKRNPASLNKRTVREVVDEMLAAKLAAKFSDVHVRDLASRLGRFADDFQMNIAGISSTMLQTWLDEMEVSGRTKKNYLRAIAAMFRFAIGRRYLPHDAIEEVKSVQQPKVASGDIEIFTPSEFAEILNAARPEMVPWLAIGGLAGLRSAELQRLDWSEVNLEEGHIEITSAKAKTASRRLTPITDNLAAWLADHIKEGGKVTGFDSWWNQIPKVVDKVNRIRRERGNETKFVWKHNALRHSFCSYRMASIKSADQVASEAGNSAQMIFRHYRKVVTETQAKEWFAITPDARPNIVRLAEANAA
ncbi:MAG TPA: site-specific integrase [Verrucomicrobiae bacterium]|jgi:integrase|nr:site-specific integrase [Verrucomicrobiae bacterium]